MHVTYEQSEKAIITAIAELHKLDTQMCIAVVDSGADLKAFIRMNGPGSVVSILPSKKPRPPVSLA